jgi:hypothetical protein
VSGTAFKIFVGTPAEVEAALNIWVESLPPRTKIRRTQLAATAQAMVLDAVVFALVNYELPEVG